MRNRKELQLKQMRRDIAKLLETGQEATARIRVEHIIRDENMMAAQEILELFCELIAVRLPIIESQRECPLDLKEAISSICFAAPRCADLPELLQVHMSFASKYGKEFVAAATELMPNCGVNRQLVELLSVRAPPPEKKLKLLKEIAEEHEIDWDPSPSETELFKPHEDLLNGPTNFVSGSKVPFPKERHDESLQSASVPVADEHYDSEESDDQLEFPEVPKVPLKIVPDSEAAPPPQPSAPLHDPDHASGAQVESDPDHPKESKQFVPFISPPSLPQASFPARESSGLSPSPSKTKTDAPLDLNDVLAAAKAAAESAERAAAAARSAASLAEVRISELAKGKSDKSPGSDSENPFYAATEKLQLDDRNSSSDYDGNPNGSKHSTYDEPELESKSSPPRDHVHDHDQDQGLSSHQPQRIPSMDDDTDFSYPNLFRSQSGKSGF